MEDQNWNDNLEELWTYFVPQLHVVTDGQNQPQDF